MSADPVYDEIMARYSGKRTSPGELAIAYHTALRRGPLKWPFGFAFVNFGGKTE